MIELHIAKSVSAEGNETQEHTPANGDVSNVYQFRAESPLDDKTFALLEWGDDVGGWECVWVIWNSEPMGFHPARTGDGTKKWRLKLVNNDTVTREQAGFVEISK